MSQVPHSSQMHHNPHFRHQQQQHQQRFSYSQVANNNIQLSVTNDQKISSQPSQPLNEDPLSPEEALLIFQEILPIINSGKSRQQQILIIFELAPKFCNKKNSNGSP
jgi:hypothetical protein